MRRRIILFIFLTSLFGIFNTCGTPAYAADETLTVNAAWADGDLLKINVTDINGINSSLALKLSDYVKDSQNEYISIQAVDLAGNKSSVIQVKNPYYVPISEAAVTNGEIPGITLEIKPVETTQSSDEEAIPTGKPFTPAGSGTVMDNVTDGDGKEFFSIKTDDGDVFYLIIDRQRNSDNVYLLNAVSEDDLLALAQKNGKTITTISTSESVTTTEQKQLSNTTVPESKSKTGGLNSGTVIFIIIAVLGVGIAGWYFKIYKNKKKIPDSSEDDDFGDNPEEIDESDDDLDFKNGEDGDSDE